MRTYLQHAYALVVGACFVFTALAAIGYNEAIAPGLERLNGDVAAATTKLVRLWA